MINGSIGRQNSPARSNSGTRQLPILYRTNGCEDGDYVAGVVTFAPIGTGRTRVNLKLFYNSKGAPAAEEDCLSSIGNHVEEDLQRFQKFVEERQDVDRLGRIPR